jgi:uroporphyrinogen III methyltransferase/synthase
MSEQVVGKCDDATKAGIVFLVGSGPGDPGLITVRGLDLIRKADVIVHDHLAGDWFVREARAEAELIYVGKKGANHTLEQLDINTLLVSRAREGKTVVRLKGGDPYVFGRGGEEAEQLVEAGIAFEVVPGVTSAIAAPAYAGIPVTHRDHASMVTFITGHESPNKGGSAIDWRNLASNPGTLVFLMGVRNLRHISGSLIGQGKPPDTPAALVRWGATPRQVSLISTLEKIADDADRKGIEAPAVLVVGSVATLHERLGWFERKPLFGKRIMITRSRAQSSRMAERIWELGGDPVLFPTIIITPLEDFSELDASISRAASFDWILFTSANAVEHFFDRFFKIKQDIRDLAGPRFGAIGPVTAEAVRKLGIKVDLLAKEFVAEGVLASFTEADVRGKRFLIPRAETAREILPEGLSAMGGEVTVVPVYRTAVPSDPNVEAIRRLLHEGRIDALTFTSSSTVRHFARILGNGCLLDMVRGATIASIGPVTSTTLREIGLPVHVEAEHYTIDGLVAALVEHFQNSRGR